MAPSDLYSVASWRLNLSFGQNLDFEMSVSWDELAPLINGLPIFDPQHAGENFDCFGPVRMEDRKDIVSPHYRGFIVVMDGISTHGPIVSMPTCSCQPANMNLCKHADMKHLHQRIKWALSKEGLKPIDLARQAEINHASISQWMSEDYRGTISAINLLKAAERLKVRPRWLLTGEGPWQPDAAETIDIEAKPVVDLALKLPKAVRNHFVLLMQDFASGVAVGGITAAGENEGTKPYLEQVGGEYERRSHQLGGKKKKS